MTSRPEPLRASCTTPHRVADQPGPAQLRGDLEVEGDGLAGRRRDGPALARRLGDDQLVRLELEPLAVDSTAGRRPGPAGSAAATAAATVAVRLPKRLPSARKFAFTRHVDQVAGERLERDDVELGGHEVAQLRRQARCQPGAETSARPERLPRLDLGAGAGGPAEVDEAAHQRDLAGERGVDQRAVDLRPAGQVHRVGQAAAAWAGSCPANSASQTSSVTNGVKGASSSVRTYRHSCRVASAAGSPSQKRRRDAADVPVGQVVDELGEPAAGAQRVEVLERRGDLERRGVRLRQRPAVEQRAVGERGRRRRRAASRSRPAYRVWKEAVFQ